MGLAIFEVEVLSDSIKWAWVDSLSRGNCLSYSAHLAPSLAMDFISLEYVRHAMMCYLFFNLTVRR